MPKNKSQWVTTPDPAYDYTKKLSTADGWAWEFLRRWTRYRSAFQQFLADEQKIGSHQFFPRKRKTETERAWWMRIAITLSANPRKLPLSMVRGRKFELTRMYDPETPWQQIEFLPLKRSVWRAKNLSALEPIVSGTGDVEWEQRPFRSSKCVIVFDLATPITPQLDGAAKILDKVCTLPKDDKILSQQNVWSDYLRVLDLKSDGYSVAQIGTQLWPDHGPDQDPVEHAKATLKQARAACVRFQRIRFVNLT